jgi:hypothetical protein
MAAPVDVRYCNNRVLRVLSVADCDRWWLGACLGSPTEFTARQKAVRDGASCADSSPEHRSFSLLPLAARAGMPEGNVSKGIPGWKF